MNRILIMSLLVFLVACAGTSTNHQKISMDNSDIGVYGIIHRDGQLTDMRLRLVSGKDRWQIENQRADGSWENVTCEEGCLLAESTDNDVKKFMGGEPPPGMWAGCLHNSAFAFCKILKQGSAEKRYVFVSLLAEQVIPIKLMRIK